MRWSVWLLVLAGCTAPNPEFGASATSSGSSEPSDAGTTASSTTADTQDTDVASTSSDGGPLSSCPMPAGQIPKVRLDGDPPRTLTHGAIHVVDENVIEVDCEDPCVAEVAGDCAPLRFEVTPALWGGWEPPPGCFRFQWFSNDLQVIDELRIGVEGQPDALTILGAAPLRANAFDVEIEAVEHCTCDGEQCCPEDAGEYAIVVHGEQDVRLAQGQSEGTLSWMDATYRVENVASSIVPDCNTPVRMQYRAYRRD